MRIMSKGAIASSISSGFNPLSIESLQGWYDASDSDTITIDESNNISQWDDKSNSANHLLQDQLSEQPTYITNYVNHFNDWMYMTNPITNRSGIFVVKSCLGSNSTNTLCPLVGYSQGSNDQNHVFLRTNSATYSVSVNGENANTGDTSINGGTLTPGNGSGTDISVSGYVPYPSDDTYRIVYYQLSSDAIMDNQAQIKNFTIFFKGQLDIAESMYFDSALSSEDLSILVSYLAEKWSVSI